MAATKYQVLYRYINEATNTAITNSMINDYKPVCELYADPDHKIFSDDITAQTEAMNEQQEIISFGNNTDNPKNNMLFAYNGTKKIKHKRWVNEAIGYVIRDWKQIRRSSIGNQGDFTKEFTTIGAATPEDGGTVVCTREVMEKYFENSRTVTTDGNYTSEEIQELIIQSTFFAIKPELTWKDHMEPPKVSSAYQRYSNVGIKYYAKPVICVDVIPSTFKVYGYYDSIGWEVTGSMSSDGLYSAAIVTREQLETTMIPGHYEEALDAPYLIKDTYKRIQLSPWFVNCTCGSLESALEKAKTLVDMIGIDNVKLIKIVPFDQFVKIK